MDKQETNTKINKLLDKLEKGLDIIHNSEDVWGSSYLSNKAFAEAYAKSLLKLRNGNLQAFSDFQVWFSPTFEWDEHTMYEGTQFAVDMLKEINDFLEGE